MIPNRQLVFGLFDILPTLSQKTMQSSNQQENLLSLDEMIEICYCYYSNKELPPSIHHKCDSDFAYKISQSIDEQLRKLEIINNELSLFSLISIMKNNSNREKAKKINCLLLVPTLLSPFFTNNPIKLKFFSSPLILISIFLNPNAFCCEEFERLLFEKFSYIIRYEQLQEKRTKFQQNQNNCLVDSKMIEDEKIDKNQKLIQSKQFSRSKSCGQLTKKDNKYKHVEVIHKFGLKPLQRNSAQYPLLLLSQQLSSMRLQMFFRRFQVQKTSQIYESLFILSPPNDFQVLFQQAKQTAIKLIENQQNEFLKTYHTFVKDYIQISQNSSQRFQKKYIFSILKQGIESAKLIMMPNKNTDGFTMQNNIYCNISCLLLKISQSCLKDFQNQQSQTWKILKTSLCLVILHELTHFIIRKLNLVEDGNKSIPEDSISYLTQKTTENIKALNKLKPFQQILIKECAKLDENIEEKYKNVLQLAFQYKFCKTFEKILKKIKINQIVQNTQREKCAEQHSIEQIVNIYFNSILNKIDNDVIFQSQYNIFKEKAKLNWIINQFSKEEDGKILISVFRRLNINRFQIFSEDEFLSEVKKIKIVNTYPQFLKRIYSQTQTQVNVLDIIQTEDQNIENMVGYLQMFKVSQIKEIESIFLIKSRLPKLIENHKVIPINTLTLLMKDKKCQESGWIMQDLLFKNLHFCDRIYGSVKAGIVSQDLDILQKLTKQKSRKQCIVLRQQFGQSSHSNKSNEKKVMNVASRFTKHKYTENRIDATVLCLHRNEILT